MSAGKLTIREVAELSLFCALMVAGKECLRVIPNVHPVTLLLLLATIIYGVKALYPAFGFALLEIAHRAAVPQQPQPRAMGGDRRGTRPVLRRDVRCTVSVYRRLADGAVVVDIRHTL